MKEVTAITVSTIWLCIAFAFSCVLLNSCVNPTENYSVDYENARRAAIDAWEEKISRVSDKCYDRTVDAIVSESEIFPESCLVPDGIGLGDHIVGCYIPTQLGDLVDDIIFIYSDRPDRLKLDTAVHEFIHEIDFCEDGGGVLDIVTINECVAELMWNLEPGYKCADIPGDYFHLDTRLWDQYGPNTIEAVGCANLVL